jgi:hypothetical protein
MTTPDNSSGQDPTRLITRKIASLGDWRGEMLSRLRDVIHKADPDIREQWKWGTAVWAHDGMVCSAGTFKDHVKLNFFRGAALDDPKGLFNAGLDAKATRAIDFGEWDAIDEPAVSDLIRAAVALNASSKT